MKKDINSIYKLYFNDVYRFLHSLCRNHHTAEDLVQDTFFRAHLYIESYDGGNVKTWLFTIARNTFIDYYRKQRRSIIKEDSFFSTLFDREKLPIDTILMEDEVQKVVRILNSLPDAQKHAVLLRDFHDFSYEEAAKVMNISLAHFKVLLFRGRQAIRKGGRNNER